METEEYNDTLDAILQPPESIHIAVTVMESAEKAGYTLDDLKAVAAFWTAREIGRIWAEKQLKTIKEYPDCPYCHIPMRPSAYPKEDIEDENAIIYTCKKCKFSQMVSV